MKILYVFRKKSGDERAIIEALRYLGHDVVTQHDQYITEGHITDADFALFHQAVDVGRVAHLNCPRVLWNFDLVIHNDYSPETLKKRRQWMEDLPYDIAFCTDGETAHTFPNCHWLTQGSQSLLSLSGEPKEYDVLFAASISDPNRKTLLKTLQKKFNVKAITHSKERVYGKDFAKLVAQSKIVVAPATPIKDNYWSNRVFMVLGHGGFLMHPYIHALSDMYEEDKEIVFYSSGKELCSKIEHYLTVGDVRQKIATNGRERTKAEHTYKHRCEELILMVADHMGSSV